jgi:hypothetical protein
MNSDLLIALFVLGAYFVCERLDVLDHVFYRGAYQRRLTDEIRHAYERAVSLIDDRNNVKRPDYSIGDVETYMFEPENYKEGDVLKWLDQVKEFEHDIARLDETRDDVLYEDDFH